MSKFDKSLQGAVTFPVKNLDIFFGNILYQNGLRKSSFNIRRNIIFQDD